MNKALVLIFLALFILPACKNIEEDDPPEKNIFIIIGQSNAASKALTDLRLSNDRVFVLNLDGEWELSSQAVNRYSTLYPECTTEETNVVYSFGWSFSEEYIEDNPGEIYFISNARGSTGIDYWSKGGFGYSEIMTRIQPYKNNIKAVLFHQGEGNARNPEAWQDAVVQMVADFREDIDRDVPFIFGQISQNYLPHFDDFNVKIYDLLGKIDNIAIANSNGVTTRDDRVHFDVDGQVTMGQSFYDAWLTF